MSGLLDSNSDDDIGNQLIINKSYADNYGDWRRKEEISKLKSKYGDDVEESDSESSSDEDDELNWSADKEKSFLKTLAALKSKDPRIYKNEERFFDDVDSEKPSTSSSNKQKEKPMFLKDFERELIVTKEGHYEDESDSDANGRNSPSYAQKQQQIRQSLKAEVDKIEDEDNLLVERKKTDAEINKEETDFLEWMKGKKNEDSEDVKDLKPLKKFWQDPSLNEGEKFLRDYIIEKKYSLNDDNSVPTYSEIVEEPVTLEEDEQELDREEEFEKKYNFRFEHPEATERNLEKNLQQLERNVNREPRERLHDYKRSTFYQQWRGVKSYPRQIDESVRRSDDKRSQKRKERLDRKDMEKQNKKAELKQLKDMTKQEIMKKVEKLRKITGNPNLNFDIDDITADFDPAKYDKMMQTAFTADYENMEEGDEKPEFSDLEDDVDDIADFDHVDIENNQTVESDEMEDKESDDAPSTSDLSKRKRARLSKALAKKKPKFDKDEMTMEEYVDKYYQLNYEDVKGDTIYRFRYRNVPNNDFGLTPEECLIADEKELNAWASLKKTSQYRNDKEEEMDRMIYQRKSQDQNKKKKILASIYAGDSTSQRTKTEPKQEAVEEIEPNIDIKVESEDIAESNETKDNTCLSKSARRKLRKRKIEVNSGEKKKGNALAVHKTLPSTSKDVVSKMSDERLKAYGINPKKSRNKNKYKK